MLFLGNVNAAGQIVLPHGDFLRADFVRSGPDLLIETPSGEHFIVPDYFMAESPPALITQGGAMLNAELVTALAGPIAPGMTAQAAQPGQAAQQSNGLGEPIGQVSESEGQVTVTHANGAQSTLTTGDSIFQGDTIETATGANVGVVFVDDTIFSLDEDARMVMDEMIYDPDTQTGVFNAQVVQGVFSFVSGQVAKTSPDGMVVSTPTSTIGIRGSTGAGKAGAEGQENTITLVPDVDGNIGEFIITTAAGTLTLNSAGATTTTFSVNAAPSAAIILNPVQIQQSFGASLTKLVQVVAHKAEADAGRAQEQAQKSSEEAQQAKAEAKQAEAESKQADETAQQADAEAKAAQAEAEAAQAEAEAAKAEAEAAGDEEAAAKAAAAEAKAAEAAAKAQAAEEKAQAEAEKAETMKAEAAEKAAAAETKTAEAENAQAQAQKASEFSTLTKSVATAQAKAFDEAQQANPNQQTAEKAATATTVQQQAQAKALADAATKATQEAVAKAATEAAARAAAKAAADKAAADKAAADKAAADKAAADKAAADKAAEEEEARDADRSTTNSAPGSTSVSVSGSEDTQITGALRVTDPNGDTLTYGLGSTASHGTASVSRDGAFTYTPDADFYGTDRFTIAASDGKGGTSLSVVNVTVHGVNETITGTAGNDTLASLADNASIDGGAGTDVLNLGGVMSNYTWSVDADGEITLTDNQGTDGTDTISNVESLAFTDGTITVTTKSAEYQVNTTTALEQQYARIIPVEDGGYVIMWQHNNGTDWDIKGQRYDAAGQPVLTGGVNEFTVASGASDQALYLYNQIEALPNGGFVVTWHDEALGVGDWTAFATIYNASGGIVTGNIQLNTFTTGEQAHASMAVIGDDELIFVWQSINQDAADASYGVYAQRFTTSGVKIGSEVQINTTTAISQYQPIVLSLDNGGYAVFWSDNSAGAGTDNIMGRFFDYNGTETVAEFMVNTVTPGAQSYPKAAVLNNGNIVLTWSDNTADGDGHGVYATILNSSGGVVKAQFMVPVDGASDQAISSVAALEDGGFVIVWHEGAEGTYDVLAQMFDASGNKVGGEIAINAYTADDQYWSSVIPQYDGGFIVTWQSDGQDGDVWGIYSQRFDADGNPVGRTTLTGDASANTFNIAAGQMGLVIDGAGGSDSLVLAGAAADMNTIKVSNVESITGSAARDIVFLGSTLNNGLTIDLGAGLDAVKLADGGNTNSFTNVEEVIGGTGDDVVTILTTFAAADEAWFEGMGGTDSLILTAGDDYFQAEDFESIDGGAGNDTLAFEWGGDIRGVTLTNVETIAIDYDNNSSTSLMVDDTTAFSTATTIFGSGNNDSISSKVGMDLTNVTLSGVDAIYVDSDTNTVGATLTLNATTLPSGINISGSGDDIIQAAGATLDLSAATLNGISSIKAAASGTTVIGTTGNDAILGGVANDILIGKNGADTMTGGGGADIFTYFTSGEGGDTITDFAVGSDKLYFAITGFPSTTTQNNPLNAADFTSGANTTSGNYFAFDTTNNNLYYDADAAGGGAGVLIATLNTAITEADIVIA